MSNQPKVPVMMERLWDMTFAFFLCCDISTACNQNDTAIFGSRIFHVGMDRFIIAFVPFVCVMA